MTSSSWINILDHSETRSPTPSKAFLVSCSFCGGPAQDTHHSPLQSPCFTTFWHLCAFSGSYFSLPYFSVWAGVARVAACLVGRRWRGAVLLVQTKSFFLRWPPVIAQRHHPVFCSRAPLLPHSLPIFTFPRRESLQQFRPDFQP